MQEKKLGHFDVSEDNTSLVIWGWGMKYNTNAPISDQVPPLSNWRLFIWFFQFVYKEVCWRFMSMDYREGVCIVARWAFWSFL